MNEWGSKKVLRRNLYMQVVNELGMRIAQGSLPVGGTLPIEDKLCEEFSVSRTVIREATKVLSGKGMVHSRPKLGTFIQERKNWNMLDPDILLWEVEVGDKESALQNIMDVREAIEPQAAKLTALRGNEELLTALKSLLDTMQNNIEDTVEKFVETEEAFHETLVNGSGNLVIMQIVSTLRQAHVLCRKEHVLATDRHVLMNYYRDIVVSLENKDGEKAFQTMSQLLQYSSSSAYEMMGAN